ncbi:hypothetical protein CI102_9002 [Trichoderma harzianum]|nr:hypothetical protein CI102_9002 [Trichoderma harzianum]
MLLFPYLFPYRRMSTYILFLSSSLCELTLLSETLSIHLFGEEFLGNMNYSSNYNGDLSEKLRLIGYFCCFFLFFSFLSFFFFFLVVLTEECN